MSTLKTISLQHLNGASPNIYLGNTGNVGIGNSSPTTKLSVDGEAFFGRADSSVEGGEIKLARSSDNLAHYSIDCYGGSTTPSMRFIDNVAGAVRMDINSSGYVTTPYQPIFYAYGGSTQSMSGTQSARIVQLPYQSTLGSRSTSNYDTTNYRFTAPIAGTYMFMMKYCITGTSTGPESVLYVNGVSQQYGAIQYSGAGYCTATTFHIWQCNASDYVEFRITNNNTTSFTVDTSRSSFAGWLMG